MPTYEYRCPAGHDFEKFYRKISDAQGEVPCPTCGKVAVRRMSAGGGLVFKGSGFYITDYGKDGKKDQKAAARSTDGAEAKSGGDAKPEAAGAASAAKDSSGSAAAGGESSGKESSGKGASSGGTSGDATSGASKSRDAKAGPATESKSSTPPKSGGSSE